MDLYSVLGLWAYADAIAYTSPHLLDKVAWQIRHPRFALGTWFFAFISSTMAILISLSITIATAVEDSHPQSMPVGVWHSIGASVIVVLGWIALMWLGAAIALIFTKTDEISTFARHICQQLVVATRAHLLRIENYSGMSVAFVESSAIIATNIPGRIPRVIISSEVEHALDPAELRAVISHERAHLHFRHGLITRLARINAACFPWVRASRDLETSIRFLTELIADDYAARSCGAASTSTALKKVAVATNNESMFLRARRLHPLSA